jgi:hypothetical protein
LSALFHKFDTAELSLNVECRDRKEMEIDALDARDASINEQCRCTLTFITRRVLTVREESLQLHGSTLTGENDVSNW